MGFFDFLKGGTKEAAVEPSNEEIHDDYVQPKPKAPEQVKEEIKKYEDRLAFIQADRGVAREFTDPDYNVTSQDLADIERIRTGREPSTPPIPQYQQEIIDFARMLKNPKELDKATAKYVEKDAAQQLRVSQKKEMDLKDPNKLEEVKQNLEAMYNKPAEAPATSAPASPQRTSRPVAVR